MADTKPKAPAARKGRELSPEEVALTATVNDKTATDEARAEARGKLKRLNFVRLANSRANKAARAIANLGTLSGPGYSYTEEDVASIFGNLYDDLRSAEAQFSKVAPAKVERTFVS